MKLWCPVLLTFILYLYYTEGVKGKEFTNLFNLKEFIIAQLRTTKLPKQILAKDRFLGYPFIVVFKKCFVMFKFSVIPEMWDQFYLFRRVTMQRRRFK